MLDSVPDIVEGCLGRSQLASVVIEGGVDAELVVRAAVSEVQTGRNAEVCLESHRDLAQYAFPGWRGMGDEDAGLCRVVDAIGSIDQLPHLQEGGAHGTLAARDGGSALAVVEQLVHDHSASETEQAKLDAGHLQQHGLRLVDDEEVVDLVLLAAEFLQHAHVLAGTPHCVDGHLELELAAQ